MTTPERALIIRQPWVELILNGTKTWEMRGSKTNIRGRIGLIEQGTGLIVGEVSIISSLRGVFGKEQRQDTMQFHCIDNASDINRWPYPWVLSNATRYETPIKYNHPMGAVIWVDLTKDGVIESVNKND